MASHPATVKPLLAFATANSYKDFKYSMRLLFCCGVRPNAKN